MYEFRDGRGEIVTVRSIRTLERLLNDAAIRAETPFRASGETVFVPASAHPVVGQLAARLNLPFSARLGAAPDPSPSPTPPAAGLEPLPSSPTDLPLPSAHIEHRIVPPAPLSLQQAPAPWRVPLPPSVSQRAIPVIATGAASGGKLAIVGFAWQLAALFGGAVALGAAGAAFGAVIGAIAGFVATCLLAREGGRRLRRGSPAASSTPIYLSAVLFTGACSLGGGGAFAAAAVTAAVLVLSWRKTPLHSP